VPRHALRIPQAHAAVAIAAERGAMLIIALLRSGLTGPRNGLRRNPMALERHAFGPIHSQRWRVGGIISAMA
jgi:hypothetical protein